MNGENQKKISLLMSHHFNNKIYNKE